MPRVLTTVAIDLPQPWVALRRTVGLIVLVVDHTLPEAAIHALQWWLASHAPMPRPASP